MVMVGLVTSVIIRVGSVTSTCLRSSAGELRTLSGPMPPLSSGTFPGQISTTSGSAADALHATTNETNTAAAEARVCMVKFLRHEVVQQIRIGLWVMSHERISTKQAAQRRRLGHKINSCQLCRNSRESGWMTFNGRGYSEFFK